MSNSRYDTLVLKSWIEFGKFKIGPCMKLHYRVICKISLTYWIKALSYWWTENGCILSPITNKWLDGLTTNFLFKLSIYLIVACEISGWEEPFPCPKIGHKREKLHLNRIAIILLCHGYFRNRDQEYGPTRP